MVRYCKTFSVAALTLAAVETLSFAAPEGEGPGLLDPGGWGAVWNLLLFLILVAVLSKFVWPHILAGLNARDEKIRHDILNAEKANKDAQQTLAQYQQQLAAAHAEARKLVDQAKADGETLRQRMLADAEKEIGRAKQHATDEIGQARHQAVQELHAHAAELAVSIAEKILQRQITEQDNRQLVEQSLAELDKLN